MRRFDRHDVRANLATPHRRLDEAGHSREKRQREAMHPLRIGSFGALEFFDEVPTQVWLLVIHREDGREDCDHLVRQIPLRQGREAFFNRVREPPLEDQEQQIGLVLRVAKHGPRRDPSTLGHLAGRRLLVPALDEKLPGGTADSLTLFLFLPVTQGQNSLYDNDYAHYFKNIWHLLTRIHCGIILSTVIFKEAAVDSTQTLRNALGDYFRDNGFGPDGGYSANWVDFSLGPIPFPFPNSPARKRAVPYHDLHHLVTGYRTDLRGEFEISAWEIGAGCKDYVAAWQLNLGGMAGGLALCPLRCFRAFVRGRRSHTFYGQPYDDALLSLTIGEARRQLGLGAVENTKPRLLDFVLFLCACALGFLVGMPFLVVGLPIAVLAYPALRIARSASASRNQIHSGPGSHSGEPAHTTESMAATSMAACTSAAVASSPTGNSSTSSA